MAGTRSSVSAWAVTLLILWLSHYGCASDITNLVFGKPTDEMPAAFGDFNSDELTDVFVVVGKYLSSTVHLEHLVEKWSTSDHSYVLLKILISVGLES